MGGVRTIAGFVVKELIQLWRDPKILSVLFIAPIVQIIVLGYAATTDIRKVELVVCDLDRSSTR
jgi:ABC-2 type transport system permease protein